MDDFYFVVIRKGLCVVTRLWHNSRVQFNRHPVLADPELVQKSSERTSVSSLQRISIYHNTHVNPHKQKKPQQRLVFIGRSRFPTPALPGSGTKGRGSYRSQSKLPQLYTKLDDCRCSVNSIFRPPARRLQADIFLEKQCVALKLPHFSGMVHLSVAQTADWVPGVVMGENRDIRRHKKRVLVRFGANEVVRVAFTDDISLTGMFIKTASIIPPNTKIRIEFMLAGDRTVELEARVMWAKKVPQNLFHLVKKSGMGVLFLQFFAGKEFLDAYLAEIGIQQ